MGASSSKLGHCLAGDSAVCLLQATKQGDAVAVSKSLHHTPDPSLRLRGPAFLAAAELGHLSILECIHSSVLETAQSGACSHHPHAVHLPAEVHGQPRLNQVHAAAPHPPAVRDGARLLDTRDAQGNTALMLASRKGHAAAVTLLLQQGADPLAVSHTGLTALHAAATAGRDACVHALLEGQPTGLGTAGQRLLDQRTPFGVTALKYAVMATGRRPAAGGTPQAGHLETVQALLRYHPNIHLATSAAPVAGGAQDLPADMRGCVRVTALHLAARLGRRDIATEILRFHVETCDGTTPDPRLHTNGLGWVPQATARVCGHANAALLTLLDPQVSLSSLASTHPKYAGVPKLQVLAARAVKSRLLSTLQTATAEVAARTSYCGSERPSSSASMNGGAPLRSTCSSASALSSGLSGASALSGPADGGKWVRDGSARSGQAYHDVAGLPRGSGDGHAAAAAATPPAPGDDGNALELQQQQQQQQQATCSATTFSTATTYGSSWEVGVRTSPASAALWTDEHCVVTARALSPLAAAGSAAHGRERDVVVEACTPATTTRADVWLAPERALSEPAWAGCAVLGGRKEEEEEEAQTREGLGAWHEVQEEDEECGVCMHEHAAVRLLPCRHRLCGTCAGKLARQMARRPTPCPFCRCPTDAFDAAPLPAFVERCNARSSLGC